MIITINKKIVANNFISLSNAYYLTPKFITLFLNGCQGFSMDAYHWVGLPKPSPVYSPFVYQSIIPITPIIPTAIILTAYGISCIHKNIMIINSFKAISIISLSPFLHTKHKCP